MSEWSEVCLVDDLKLRLVASNSGLSALQFMPAPPPIGVHNDNNSTLRAATRQLQEYFAGRLRTFTIPLDLKGTDFQVAVWRHLQEIPFGETKSHNRSADRTRSGQSVPPMAAIQLQLSFHATA
jgi:O6-methylguanine-DNA--protein-cysteine methyltransferase